MNKSKTYQMAVCALFAALMCVFGPMSVPIGPIPVSLTNFVIYLAVFLLGTKATTISYLLYLLLGTVGLPVFSGYAGGIGKLAGPTGGYLIGFILMAIISGLAFEFSKRNVVITCLGMVLGTAVDYLFGTLWFMHQTGNGWVDALTVCVYPFIPFDLAKIVIAAVLGKSISIPLIKAGFIEVAGAQKTEVKEVQ